MRGRGTVPVWSQLAGVRVSLDGPGLLDMFAVRPAGGGQPDVVVEGYGDGEGLLLAGSLPVWELNQAVSALTAVGDQARRLAVRDDGRGHAGYVDLVCSGDEVLAVLNRTPDGSRSSLTGRRLDVAGDVNRVLHQFLRMTRVAAARPQVVVLPDVRREVVPSA